MNLFLIIIGTVLLVGGGEMLVRGAVNIALRFHISTLVVGMTVVAFGTSAPELVVSLRAMFAGHPEIAVGNVIGSNITNIALILGITALIFPVKANRNSYLIDWPMLMFSSFVLIIFMYLNYDPMMEDSNVTSLHFVNGLIMISLLVWFTVFLIRKSRKATKAAIAETNEEFQIPISSPLFDLIFILIGIVALSYGAQFLVDGVVGMALKLGISDYIISVTIVAFGTSLPELITSVVAAFRKHSDLAVGNIIGSNIFNTLGILGVTSIFKSVPITSQVWVIDMWWMIGLSVILFPLMIFGKKISRWEGLGLVSLYVVYIYFVIVNS